MIYYIKYNFRIIQFIKSFLCAGEAADYTPVFSPNDLMN